MTSVQDLLKAGKYKNSQKFPSLHDPAFVFKRIEYTKEEKFRLDLFYKDICEERGLNPDSPRTRKVYSKAWKDGHSSGLHEVYYHWNELWDFLDELQKI